MPDYSLEELKAWVFAQNNFIELFNKWGVDSNYYMHLIPSCDRKDDYKPYTLNNIQLMTWGQNYQKYNEDKRNGVNKKTCKAVVQMDSGGSFMKEYYSVRQAYKETGVQTTQIISCCRGRLKSSKGYCWMYSLGVPINNNLREVK